MFDSDEIDMEQKYNSPEQQEKLLELQRLNCTLKYGEEVMYINDTADELVNNTHCPAVWDGILCWANTTANSLASQPCPLYIAGFDRPDNDAIKFCKENGHWYKHPEINKTWTNFTQCFTADTATVVMKLPELNTTFLEKYWPALKTISRVGYSVSFSTLVIAFIIMVSIKKLHCARNKLHMHLFASFIFRAFMAFLREMLFIKGVGLDSDILVKDEGSYFVQQPQSNNWGCKLLTSFWQYFITANYSWILMEGLYLHNLILLALFSDSNSSIIYYIILGWGLPVLVVIPWIVARLILDDTLCWTTYEHYPSTFLIIRIPTMISILINLVLFINIARVLLVKLSSPISEEAQRFKRWARSTLVLVPLFGVHYAAFLGMSSSIGLNETVELIWLFCDQLFASFQGFFVAILYCFLNGEVRAELTPRLKSFLSKWLSTPCCRHVFNCGDFSRHLQKVREIRSEEDSAKINNVDNGTMKTAYGSVKLKGRASVCTTLSCSSLYNSHGVSHKFQSRKGRWKVPQQTKHENFISQEKNDLCHNCEASKNCQETALWNQHQNINDPSSIKCAGANCLCANSIIPETETTACLDHQEDYKQDLNSDLEMITMAHKT